MVSKVAQPASRWHASPVPRHRFVQAFETKSGPEPRRARERASVDGRDRGGRTVAAPTVRPRGAGLRRAKAMLGRLLRPLGLGLFAGVVAYPVLYLALGGVAIAAFTVHVASFFLVLDLWVFVAAMAFVAARDWTVHVPYAPGEPNVLNLDPAALGADGESVVGIVERLEGTPEGAVLLDAWGRTVTPRRVVEGDDFLLRPLGAGAPVVVRLESAPLVLGEPTRGAAALVPLSREGRAELLGEDVVYVRLSEGDRVRVHAGVFERIARLDHIEVGGEVRRARRPGAEGLDPYRGAGPGPGRLVRSTAHRPLVLVRLAGEDS